MESPVTLPCNNDKGLGEGLSAISLLFTVAIEPVRSLLFAEPYPITTTCSRADDMAVKAILNDSWPLMGNSCDSNPTEEKTNVASFGAVKVKLPSLLVEVPVEEPFTETETPASPSPVGELTFPEMVVSAQGELLVLADKWRFNKTRKARNGMVLKSLDFRQ